MGLPGHVRCAHRQLIGHMGSEEGGRRAATARAPGRITMVASQCMKPHWSLWLEVCESPLDPPIKLLLH